MAQAQGTTGNDTFTVDFRNAMARLGAAVNIVTTDGEAGRTGFAATAVCSISDMPPSLLVCINRSSSAYAPVLANGVLCVNVAGDNHQPVCQLFAGKTPAAERFSLGAWSALETGSPVLEDALESFDCRITATYSIGTHDILVCKVVALKPRRDGRALVYFERSYRSV
ncbi:flavin reductase [Agrobacterium rosae]|uniref:Flavin reductase n=1 Tax=Agrobacterium rosae TaxID=1972867 RepID=A0AAW9FIV4_9HYPH|nr:flavin reductase [Agrobacterium rosae]MDX8304373.1 flavin reductase [Agrobacterium rosae]